MTRFALLRLLARFKRVFAVPLLVWNLSAERHLGLIAAGVAFFAILGVFPALASVVAIWGLFADPGVVASHMSSLSEFLPPDAFKLLNDQVQGLVGADAGALGWTTVISVGAALWSARAGMAALVQGINAIFGQENRGGIQHQVVSLILTFAIVGAIIVALAAGVAVPIAMTFVNVGPFTAQVAHLASWAIAPLATITGIALVYRYGPNLPGTRPRLISTGLLVAVVLWLMASAAFSYYLTNFGNYNKVYGSIGAVIALLMWLYLSAYAVLMGAAVNAARHDIKIREQARLALQ